MLKISSLYKISVGCQYILKKLIKKILKYREKCVSL